MAVGYKGGLATGLLLAAGAALLRPWLAQWARPVAKTAIKQGLTAYEVGRSRIAELGEYASDMLAEAQVELALERQQAPDVPPPPRPAEPG